MSSGGFSNEGGNERYRRRALGQPHPLPPFRDRMRPPAYADRESPVFSLFFLFRIFHFHFQNVSRRHDES
jgi:hypothetical protein